MNALRAWLFIFQVFAFVSACGGSQTCVAGRSETCACTDGRNGAQTCGPNGTFEMCVCTAGMGGGAGGGTGGGGASSPKRVFVTSTRFQGTLGGLAGADQTCSLAAQGANLGGTWTAWLSDGTSDAIGRIADVGPWFLVAGMTEVFHNKGSLTATPLVPINMDEYGSTVSAAAGTDEASVWTGTDQGGHGTGENCLSWTRNYASYFAAVGSVTSTSLWSRYGSDSECSQSARLYCFER
jgi:hypothetical protein